MHVSRATLAILAIVLTAGLTTAACTSDPTVTTAADSGAGDLAPVADDSAPTEAPLSGTDEAVDAFHDVLVARPGESFPAWKSTAELVAIDANGEWLFSGNDNAPFFGIELREWEQIDGSHVLNILINNRTETRGQCGTEIRGTLSGLGDGRLRFHRGVFPVVRDDPAFDAVDTVGCVVYAPVDLERIFAAPFEVLHDDPGQIAIRTAGETVLFRPWMDAPPVVPDFEPRLQCPGQIESAISEVEWPKSGPESAEAAIAGNVDMLRAELAFRSDWAELELVDVVASGSSAQGFFVDDDNIVRLIFNAESHEGVWLVTGRSSCSPG